ncbi:FAD binding domain-containing protein [Poseidonocella sp. HB161398]|uniref:FAD binding domain-containing protein n=1 Tax=Poseidonocella sp. HB161398 TaxID=2320855 RepID=UPI001108D0C3|nr:FAD binding domain-containing protein [Poseidonocella sp. HB161398]
MDLNGVTEIAKPGLRSEIPPWQEGDGYLAGGTWLFSEPQPGLRRLTDLQGLGWDPLEPGPEGLGIAATCPVARLAGVEAPPAWRAAPLFEACCRAFLASFKIWNTATVGGNLCMALPAGPMLSLAAGLEGVCEIWTADGGTRHLPAEAFARAPRVNALAPGEILRRLHLPRTALEKPAAFRRISLAPEGRSGALLIGTRDAQGLRLAVTAAVPAPVILRFDGMPEPAALAARIEAAIPPGAWYDDIHGRPDWRRHVTLDLAREIRDELAEVAP